MQMPSLISAILYCHLCHTTESLLIGECLHVVCLSCSHNNKYDFCLFCEEKTLFHRITKSVKETLLTDFHESVNLIRFQKEQMLTRINKLEETNRKYRSLLIKCRKEIDDLKRYSGRKTDFFPGKKLDFFPGKQSSNYTDKNTNLVRNSDHPKKNKIYEKKDSSSDIVEKLRGYSDEINTSKKIKNEEFDYYPKRIVNFPPQRKNNIGYDSGFDTRSNGNLRINRNETRAKKISKTETQSNRTRYLNHLAQTSLKIENVSDYGGTVKSERISMGVKRNRKAFYRKK